MGSRLSAYTHIPALADLVLEESYVLAIETEPASVRFVVDFCLAQNHPNWRKPLPNEWACYHKGQLVLHPARVITWKPSGHPGAVDAAGEIDFGDFDEFDVDGERIRMSGDWGEMEVLAESIEVLLDPQ
jgi:hypothetical protein